MGSTNKTTNLQLPQWIGTDKPTFLGDFNDAFLKIDEGYGTISGNATTAIAQAGQAVQDAENALTKATSVETIANQANTNANTALSTANSALETANSASDSIATINQTLNTYVWQSGQATPASGLFSNFNSFVNKNNGLDLMGIAISGTLEGAPTTINDNTTLFTLPSWARPSTERTIYGGLTAFSSGGASVTADFRITTKGEIQNIGGNIGDIKYVRTNIMLCTASW